MSLHIGEVDTSVEVQGVAGGTGTPAAVPPPTPWEEHDRYRRLAEDEQRRRERLSGEVFDA
jgi:hypothetical protein